MATIYITNYYMSIPCQILSMGKLFSKLSQLAMAYTRA